MSLDNRLDEISRTYARRLRESAVDFDRREAELKVERAHTIEAIDEEQRYTASSALVEFLRRQAKSLLEKSVQNGTVLQFGTSPEDGAVEAPTLDDINTSRGRLQHLESLFENEGHQASLEFYTAEIETSVKQRRLTRKAAREELPDAYRVHLAEIERLGGEIGRAREGLELITRRYNRQTAITASRLLQESPLELNIIHFRDGDKHVLIYPTIESEYKELSPEGRYIITLVQALVLDAASEALRGKIKKMDVKYRGHFFAEIPFDYVTISSVTSGKSDDINTDTINNKLRRISHQAIKAARIQFGEVQPISELFPEIVIDAYRSVADTEQKHQVQQIVDLSKYYNLHEASSLIYGDSAPEDNFILVVEQTVFPGTPERVDIRRQGSEVYFDKKGIARFVKDCTVRTSDGHVLLFPSPVYVLGGKDDNEQAARLTLDIAHTSVPYIRGLINRGLIDKVDITKLPHAESDRTYVLYCDAVFGVQISGGLK